jgi:hypothetical protein
MIFDARTALVHGTLKHMRLIIFVTAIIALIIFIIRTYLKR